MITLHNIDAAPGHQTLAPNQLNTPESLVDNSAQRQTPNSCESQSLSAFGLQLSPIQEPVADGDEVECVDIQIHHRINHYIPFVTSVRRIFIVMQMLKTA